MVRVASFQAAPKATLEYRLKQIHQVLKKADESGIDFICFSEGFLTGYYSEEEMARQTSLEVQGEIFKNFLSEISHYNVTVTLGFNELDEDRIFDSVAVIEGGKLLGLQRKHYLYHQYFSSSKDFSPFFSKDICFGVIICLDAQYFEPSRLLALQGATVLFCPMCNKVPLNHPYAKRPLYHSHFVARSFENRCWLVAADWVWPDDGQMVCPGHSAIYDPDGCEIVRSRESEEELLVIDIPKEQLFQEKGRRLYGSPILAEKITELQSSFRAPSLLR